MSTDFEPPGRARSAQVDAGISVSSSETTRRIITGHDENGKAIFHSDEVLKTANPYKEDLSPPAGTIPGFTLIHRAEGFPTTSVNGPVTEWHGKRIPLSYAGGTVCRVVDFPPIGEDGDAFMHRTQSLDFGVVLKGSIKLILDDGLETTMHEGDVVVQRGTIHAWKNVSKENCKVLFVLVPAVPVKVEKTGENLRETANTGELHDD